MEALATLNEVITRRKPELCNWYRHHFEKAKPPVYASVDIRVSGYKLSVVDTNLFPAGFNNIYPRDLQMAAAFVTQYFEKRHPKVKKILLLPEDHTRNQPYFENICAILRLFDSAGFEIKIGTLNPELRKDSVEISAVDCGTLTLHRAFREGNRLKVANFDPDFILINNDFSQAPPEALLNLQQPIEPALQAGWFSRRKSRHFEILGGLIDEFCQILDVDPWLMRADTQFLKDIDVQDAGSRERLAQAATELLQRTRNEFKKHGVSEEPYLFLKDNSGTYGFAVMNIKDPSEILTMNSKARKKMSSGKGKAKVDEFLVQEGIPTKIFLEKCPAEPVIYLVGGEVIGGFFRTHCEQNEQESLNVKGMLFSLLTFSSPLDTSLPEETLRDDTLLQVCGNLAKVATLALGYEIQELIA